MRTIRIYHPTSLLSIKLGEPFQLSDDAHHHLTRVLRIQIGAQIELFHQPDQQAKVILTQIDKKQTTAQIELLTQYSVESPLRLHLGQVISRGEKMEFTIQKSVELGVNQITPLISERCGVKLNEERFKKKLQQWQQIAIAACEQCGRNNIPEIMEVTSIKQWCLQQKEIAQQNNGSTVCLNLYPDAPDTINTLPDNIENISLLIGPEGGLTEQEIQMSRLFNFKEMRLGPRVLRTETAAMTAITALQVRFGDLG